MLRCYCMTFNTDESMLVVALCIFGCIKGKFTSSHYPVTSNTSALNELLCGKRFHREGQLCGKCEDTLAFPVYSYDLGCVKCEKHFAKNLLKYIVAAFLPLTLFFIIVVTFRIRVTSGVMNGFILISQIISTPTLSREYILKGHHVNTIPKVIVSLYGIWNLDFFRLLYSPFCLHPETTMVQILALDYTIAAYPLALLIVAYLLVKLHDSGFKLIVWLWKPFHWCFVCFRRDWTIKTSLIDAFATFLLLSYMKFLSVSFDLLSPVRIFNIHGETQEKLYLYWDGSTEYFGREHLPYALLAVTVIIIFNTLPLLLLFLYPCKWFQNCLHCCRPRQSVVLHTFMDSFQGCYKDGTNGSRDYRWYSALYLCTQILVLVVLAATASEFSLPFIGIVFLILVFVTAMLQPYKLPVHNRNNIFILCVMILIIFTATANVMAISSDLHVAKTVAACFFGLALLMPLIYIIAAILYKLLAHRICGYIRAEDETYERTLPERMVNVEECAALLADPMEINIYTE